MKTVIFFSSLVIASAIDNDMVSRFAMSYAVILCGCFILDVYPHIKNIKP